MKKLLWLILFLISATAPAHADEKAVLQQAYQLLLDKYIEPVEIPQLFEPAIKSLQSVDKNLRVVLEKNSVTVYYKNKIHKVYSRPQNGKDALAWAKFTDYLLSELKQISPILDNKDFELVEVMLYNGMQKLDKNSHYFPTLDIGQTTEKPQGYASGVVDNKVLYVRLGTINDYTAQKLTDDLQKHQELNGIVLDLRGNKGGYLAQALRIADNFLSSGKIIYTIGKDAGKRKNYRAHEGEFHKNAPMVILVDGKTASSAEVLALSLKEHGRAKLVGAQTYGKNSVQNIYKLDNGAYMSLTTEKFFSPRGIPVEEVGLRPNVCSEVFDTTSDIAELVAYPYNFMCQKLSRDSSYDLDVALYILAHPDKKED